MIINNLAALVNIIICTVIALTLMLYQRSGARHRPGISFIAYLIVLGYASIPLRSIYGLYQESHWLVVLVNVLICAAVLKVRGNVAKLIDIWRG